MYLYENNLTGIINLQFNKFKIFKFRHLTGQIPNEITNLENLVGIDLTFNNLYIPQNIGEFNLEYLYLYENNFTGQILDDI